MRQWVSLVGARTAFTEPGSPSENGYIERFNARLRDELLNGEIFYRLKEAQVLIEAGRRHDNAVRPHGSLGYRPLAPETTITPSWPPDSAPPSGQLGGGTLNALTFKPHHPMGPVTRADALRNSLGVVALLGLSIAKGRVTVPPDLAVKTGPV